MKRFLPNPAQRPVTESSAEIESDDPYADDSGGAAGSKKEQTGSNQSTAFAPAARQQAEEYKLD